MDELFNGLVGGVDIPEPNFGFQYSEVLLSSTFASISEVVGDVIITILRRRKTADDSNNGKHGHRSATG